MGGTGGRSGLRRPGAAGVSVGSAKRIRQFRQRRILDVPGANEWRGRRPQSPWERGSQVAIPAEDDHGRVDRHDVPDGAPLRHRSRPHQDPRGASGRWLLRHHRPEDLHLRRRARPRRQHRPSCAGANRGRAHGRKGHLAVPRAEILARPEWRRRQAQRRHVRFDRAQNGHSRQRDGGAQLRRRQELGWSASSIAAFRRCS